jgi:cobalt-zinc-cadmium efflux system outer membrane protein
MNQSVVWLVGWWHVMALLAADGAGRMCAAQPGEAAGEQTLTLEDALRLAKAHNPELRASGALVAAAAGRAYQARQWPNPDLEYRAEDWPVGNGRGFGEAKQTLGIAQTLPYPGKKSLDRRIGRAGLRGSEADLALRQTEIVRDVKAAFFRVLASARVLEVTTQLVAVAEASASAARKRVAAGAAPDQEQLRAEVHWEQARAELLGIEREVAAARQVLAGLLGRPDQQEARLAGTLAELPDAALMETDAEVRLAQHPSLAAARARLGRAQLEQERARLEPYPDVKVGVAGGRNGEADQSIIELGFSVPLPVLDRAKGRRQEARANVSAAEAEAQSAQQQLRQEWANALKRYRTAAEQAARHRERILPKADEALRLVRIGFAEGKFNFIDLVDTQRTAAEARLAYQQRLLEMNLAQADLEALLRPEGGLPSGHQ